MLPTPTYRKVMNVQMMSVAPGQQVVYSNQIPQGIEITGQAAYYQVPPQGETQYPPQYYQYPGQETYYPPQEGQMAPGYYAPNAPDTPKEKKKKKEKKEKKEMKKTKKEYE